MFINRADGIATNLLPGKCFLSGKWKTTKTVFQTLGNSFLNRNRVLFGIGLGLLAVCIVASLFRKKLKQNKWTKRIYRGGWLVAWLLILISMTAGDGKGLGFGDGSGVGIGDGAGAGIGSEVGVGDEGNEGTQEVFASSADELCIRIHGTRVTIDDEPYENEETLSRLLSEVYYDGMNVTVWDDYADNMSFLWVTETIKNLAMPYEVKRVDE